MSKGSLDIVRSVTALRAHVAEWRGTRERIALVPTMGALHDGHLSLVRRAKEVSDKVCISLYVNPTQFAAHEDLKTYPRDEDKDHELLISEGVDLLYAPKHAEMYPEGDVTRVTMPGMGDCLEGRCRPGFFTGVATVVSKLLIQCMPHIALFGEKDFQQLQIIRRMVTDLSIPVEIVGVPTVREEDGLAMSSRNVYLSEQERKIAPKLYQALNAIRDHLHDTGKVGGSLKRETDNLIACGFASVDYLSIRDSMSFLPVDEINNLSDQEGQVEEVRILGAAQLGRARLIDNISV